MLVLLKKGISVQIKYVRGKDRFIGSVICSVIRVYTTYDNRSRVYIYEREGKFDTPPKIDNISIL